MRMKMNKMYRMGCVSIGLCLMTGFTMAQSVPVKVACVGDSITYGAAIVDRETNCYPAQLGAILGSGYTVANFGVNGATMLKRGNRPYWAQAAYTNALAFSADIVIIKLGSNDSKPGNWVHKADYVADYVELIQTFQTLDSKPTVWVCYPVPAYPENFGITDQVIKNEVMPLMDQVSEQAGVQVIDLYSALSDHPELFPDKVHPNAEGAMLMAKEIAAIITSGS